MNRWKSILIGFVTAVFVYECCSTIPRPEVKIQYRDPPSIYKSVVMVQADLLDGSGRAFVASGFAVTNKHLVTAGHFCEGVKEDPNVKDEIDLYSVNNNDEVWYVGEPEIVKYDMEPDLCLLKLDRHGVVPADIIKKYFKNVRLGDSVKTIGSPMGIFPVETSGKVFRVFDGDKQLATSVPVYGGNSGGPILNDVDQVIGVFVILNVFYKHLSYATPAHILRKFLIENKVKID